MFCPVEHVGRSELGYHCRQYFCVSPVIQIGRFSKQETDCMNAQLQVMYLSDVIYPPEFVRFPKGESYVRECLHNGTRGLFHELQSPNIVWLNELVLF